MSLGTVLLTAGCGDDTGTSNSEASTSGGSTDGTSPTSTPSTDPTTDQTTAPTTTGIASGMSESASSTATTGTTAETGTTTGVVETGSSGEPDTTTTGVDETTGTTSGTSTGVVETTTETTGGETGDTTTGNAEACLLAQQHEPCDANSNDALHAMGLNCTSLGAMWINNDNAVTVTALDFQAPPPMGQTRTWQAAKSYGTFIDPNTNKPFWSPREGDKLLMISSGLLPTPNGQGAVIIDDGDVYGDTAFGGKWDSDVMPPPMSAQNGSPDPMGFTNCDGINDCSNTILDQWDLGGGNAEDKMWFSFKLKAPAIADGDVADAKGYTFDFAYFSAEFPEYVDSQYNDIFVVWQNSEDYTGNVTFIDGQPMTVTALWPIDFEANAPELAGTGHSDAGGFSDGGATGWYKATGGIKPGEEFLLAFAVFDMGDSSFDTTALIDNWQWDCEGCVPNEVMSCGIEPM